MRITLLPHARLRMEQRGISLDEVRAVLEGSDREYPGDYNRIVAEKVFPGRRLAVKVVYDLGSEDAKSDSERIVVTVELGRPSRR